MDRIRRMFGIRREDYQSRQVDDSNNKHVVQEDCLECRIIGTAIPIGAAGYILYHYRKKAGVYKGQEAVLLNVLCVGMSSVLLFLGGCRFFGCGIFKHLKGNSTTNTSQDR